MTEYGGNNNGGDVGPQTINRSDRPEKPIRGRSQTTRGSKRGWITYNGIDLHDRVGREDRAVRES